VPPAGGIPDDTTFIRAKGETTNVTGKFDMSTDHDSDPAAVTQPLRLACSDLSRRLRAGEECRAEEFLTGDVISVGEREAMLELLYTEFVVREELGHEPDPEDWYRRFPLWRRDLEELFQVHRFVCEQGDSPQQPDDTTSIGATHDTHRGDVSVPQRIQRLVAGYELREEIGRGGMGVVYKARQFSLGRDVALKMILSGEFATATDYDRFRNEAQSAASLQHPNIAQVYEAGEHDGRAYLCMELVEGANLEALLAKAPLTARSAAELVETLARAVQYAHEHGVIHRDLKPSNVLMSVDGQPKITDFGLAKRIQSGQDSALTRTGVVLGTPSYMAPEQAAGRAEEITAAADVYALGAIFYETLTGRPPFVGDSALDTLRQVQEREPVSPRQFDERLPLDVETICLKCLEKDPVRRYAGAGELADELRRFLSGVPIHARPVSSAHHAWRWCRRKPVLATMLSIIALLLAALASGGTWFGWRQSELRKMAVAESSKAQAAEALAERSAEEATAVTDYLVQTFRSPDPWLEGKEVTVAKALENAIASLDSDWAEDAAGKAALCEAFAQTLLGWGEYDRAVELAQRAYEMRMRLEGPQHIDTMRAAITLADAKNTAGQLDDAMILSSAVDQALQNSIGRTAVDSLRAAVVRSQIMRQLGDLDASISLLDQTYRTARDQYGEYGEQTQIVLTELVSSRQAAGDVGTLTVFLSEKLEEGRAQLGEDNQTVVNLESQLADNLRLAGDLKRAVELYESNLRRRRRILGDDHPDTLAAMNNLAAGYAEQGKSEDALRLCETILPIRREKLGPNHRHTLGSMHNLGMSYYNLRRDSEALNVFRETLGRRREVLGPAHRQTLESMTALGRVLSALHQWDECIPLLEETLRTMREVHGPDHHETLDTAWVLGMAYNQSENYSKALKVLEATQQAMIMKFGAPHPRTLRCSNSLAISYRELGDLRRACELQQEIVKSCLEELGADHINTCTARLNYGILLDQSEKFDAVEEELRELLVTLQKGDYPEFMTCRTQCWLGDALTHLDRYAEAEALLTESHQGLAALDVSENPSFARYRRDTTAALVRLYVQWGRPAQADKWRSNGD
jgi:serine/threonine protein kinase